ncbi:amino acid transporter [Nadsonia fulvescens var. elongata DSM 6958]|uniref:Amino acid transporter n=1 Tax=Nadsonia fulvescens var. elongata DSM 6958 TaxID=857566 RepID=A0A1E3PQD5_9ASCO|nr:amino acid transporter [Nadsonia fulvescens var. elongata DSM 6958]
MQINQLDLQIAEMGYKPELRRTFGVWSILGIGFGLTNSWFGISASLVTGISSGGPMLIIYGIIIVATMSACIGVTLSELSSAFPNSGGQYFWTLELAPKKYASFWGYMCGALAWAGSIFSSASTCIAIASGVVGMYALNAGPDFVVKPWMVFVCFQALNFCIFWFNVWGRFLPKIAQVALYTSLFSFTVITLVVVIVSRGHYNTAHFVFVQFNNATGWSSSGIAFIVGLINPNWSFSCIDSATHMAEEVERPDKMIPIAIMGTVAIGFITSFCYAIAMFFCIRDLDTILASYTGVPILDIFYQALASKPGALCLEFLILCTAVGCVTAGHTWQARLCWSFSRDHGLPGSKWWSQVHPKCGVPLYAHILSCTCVALVGVLYLASQTAYNSMVTGCINFLLLSYAIPTICLLKKGRNNIKHGVFWLGKFGTFCNFVTIGWTVFACVFYCFPYVLPVTKDNMNYASVFMVGVILYLIAYWFLRGKRVFRSAEERSRENEELTEKFE